MRRQLGRRRRARQRRSRSWSASRSRSRVTSPIPATRPSSATSSGPTRSTSSGGILGRKVQLKIVDDASEPQPGGHELPDADHARQGRPRVRPVLDAADGPGRASRVALRLRVPRALGRRPARLPGEAAATCSSCSRRRSSTAATRSSSTSCRCRPSQRPKTAAYPEPRRPVRRSRSPSARAAAVRGARASRPSTQQVYPPEMADLTPVVEKMAAAKPDMVFAGTQSDDAYSMVNGDGAAGLQPEVPVPVQRRQLAGGVPEQGGRQQRERHLQLRRLVPRTRRRPETSAFIKAYLAKYGGTAEHRLRLGRGLRGRRGRSRRWRRRPARSTTRPSSRRCTPASWPTVEGNLSWDKYGAPSGSDAADRVDRRQARAGVAAGRRRWHAPISPQAAVGRLSRNVASSESRLHLRWAPMH